MNGGAERHMAVQTTVERSSQVVVCRERWCRETHGCTDDHREERMTVQTVKCIISANAD